MTVFSRYRPADARPLLPVMVEHNPCLGIKKYKEKWRTRYINHDEFNALLAHLSEPMQNLFTLVYLTGQRINDVLNLRQSDITEAGIRFTQKKTGAKLLIEVTEDIAEVLGRIQPSKQGWLFHTKTDKAMHYKTAYNAYVEARKLAGISNATIHDLRTKSLTDANDEDKDAQKLGGHSSQSTTKRYLRGRKPTKATAPNLPQKP